MSLRAGAFGLLGAALTLGACQTPDPARQGPRYGGFTNLIIDEGLVNFLVTMNDANDEDEVARYAECVASGYAFKRGLGFARHVRTNVTEEAGIWRADAVYTMSPTLPAGLRTIDVEIAVQNCTADGIPTV